MTKSGKTLWQNEKLLVLSNFFFCHYVFKKLSAAEASESVYKGLIISLTGLFKCLCSRQLLKKIEGNVKKDLHRMGLLFYSIDAHKITVNLLSMHVTLCFFTHLVLSNLRGFQSFICIL